MTGNGPNATHQRADEGSRSRMTGLEAARGLVRYRPMTTTPDSTLAVSHATTAASSFDSAERAVRNDILPGTT
jgi:hypothetical protein